MKNIQIDDDLYAFIASQTQHIGESASDILRRLLVPEQVITTKETMEQPVGSNTSTLGDIQESETVEKQKSAIVERKVNENSLLDRITFETLSVYSKNVERFLFILSQIYAIHTSDFNRVEEIKGKNRIYFATTKEALLETGSSTNPKKIPDSEYWVVTNNNTGKKVAMLEQVLLTLKYDRVTTAQVLNLFTPVQTS